MVLQGPCSCGPGLSFSRWRCSMMGLKTGLGLKNDFSLLWTFASLTVKSYALSSLTAGDEDLFKCRQGGPLSLTLRSKLLINILDPVIFLSLLYQWHLATGSQFATGKSLSNLISTALQELPVPHLLLVMMFSLPTDQQLNQHRNLLLKVNSRTN